LAEKAAQTPDGFKREKTAKGQNFPEVLAVDF
jgi:hypothetical protein